MRALSDGVAVMRVLSVYWRLSNVSAVMRALPVHWRLWIVSRVVAGRWQHSLGWEFHQRFLDDRQAGTQMLSDLHADGSFLCWPAQPKCARCRSKTQGIALSLGDKLILKQKG